MTKTCPSVLGATLVLIGVVGSARGEVGIPHLRTSAFVAPLLSGLRPHGYTVVDNLVHAVLDIIVYAVSRLPMSEWGAA